MTAIREKSTAALAEALATSTPLNKKVARLALAASPTLAADLDFAIAWREAVAALPEDGRIKLESNPHAHFPHQRWTAEALVWDRPEVAWRGLHRALDSTPTEALVALTEKLREAQR